MEMVFVLAHLLAALPDGLEFLMYELLLGYYSVRMCLCDNRCLKCNE